MTVEKMSVSFDPDLGDAIRRSAARSAQPLSTWLAEAAASKLGSEALAEFLAERESELGGLTAQEMARAERELGVGRSDFAV